MPPQGSSKKARVPMAAQITKTLDAALFSEGEDTSETSADITKIDNQAALDLSKIMPSNQACDDCQGRELKIF